MLSGADDERGDAGRARSAWITGAILTASGRVPRTHATRSVGGEPTCGRSLIAARIIPQRRGDHPRECGPARPTRRPV